MLPIWCKIRVKNGVLTTNIGGVVSCGKMLTDLTRELSVLAPACNGSIEIPHCSELGMESTVMALSLESYPGLMDKTKNTFE